jgi:sugar-phosphatase
MRIDQVVELWRSRKGWSGTSTEELAHSIVNRVAELFAEEPRAREGAREVISHLASMGFPLAVASASPQQLIERNLASVGLRAFFHVVHSAEFEVAGKPHPAVFLSAADKLQVSANRCIVFEDSLNGIKAAKAAGMSCVAIREDATPFQEATTLADYAIESFVGFSRTALFKELFPARDSTHPERKM